MDLVKQKKDKRKLRHARVRGRVSGTAVMPRLSVFRSLKQICAQLIDDESSKTLVSVSSQGLKVDKESGLTGKTGLAYETGLVLAKEAVKKGVEKVCFDRGGYKYHGRVKAVADGARAGGLKF